jgi:ribosome biogenesis GTPase
VSRAAQDVARAPGALENGLVTASRRRHYAVLLDSGAVLECLLKGRSTTLACGDRVQVARAAGGGSIEAALPRTTLFYRSDAFKEKLIAANVTQVIGVVAPDIGVDEELVNRWIVAAEVQGCRFVLAANKSDRPDFAPLLARLEPFAALGYAIVPLSARRDVAPLLPLIRGQRSVLVGQSGMGKSTILNAIAPEAQAKTAEISAALAAGRHTTSQSTLYPLPADRGGGWVVDSPGLKVFGLAHVAPESIAQGFAEIRPLLGHCRFRDCRHDREPGCAIMQAVESGRIAPHRVALLQRLVGESQAARAPGR